MQRLSGPILFAVIVGVIVALSSTAWAGETVGRATSVAKPAVVDNQQQPVTASSYLDQIVSNVRNQLRLWLGIPIMPIKVEPVIDKPVNDDGPQNGSTGSSSGHPKFDRDVYMDNGGDLVG